MKYTIKPLKWKEHSEAWRAESIFGELVIFKSGPARFWLSLPGEAAVKTYSTEDAEVLAWHWYLGRLTPALEEA